MRAKLSGGSKAFTLIELLVVISIISLLSSVVLASLNAAREKGRIAADQEFAANVYHGIGSDMLLYVPADEGSGTSVYDVSGRGYVGTAFGGASWSSNTPSGKGTALAFNGTSGYVRFPKIDADIDSSVTISAWIYPTNATLDAWQGLTGNCTFCGFFSFIRNSQLYFDITTPNGRVFTGRGTIVNNRWQYVLMSYDGATMRWYIDGKLVGTAAQTGAVNKAANAYIGWSSNSTEYFYGMVDDVRIYSAVLAQRDVERLYAEGLPKHESFALR